MEDTMGYPKMIQNGHSNGDDGVINHGIFRSSFRQTDGTIISALHDTNNTDLAE